MKQLSAAYALLSKDEKNALSKVPGSTDPSLEEVDNEVTRNGNRDHVDRTHNDDANGPRNTMLVNTSMVRGTLSAQIRYNQAQKAVNTGLDEVSRAYSTPPPTIDQGGTHAFSRLSMLQRHAAARLCFLQFQTILLLTAFNLYDAHLVP